MAYTSFSNGACRSQGHSRPNGPIIPSRRSFRFHLNSYSLILVLIFVFLPSAKASGYEAVGDFTQNLFTDLSPLLQLFGEDVSKQFLSQSIDVGDDILLAMAPVGILTIMIGAIRVAGSSGLRTIFGKAREPASLSEIELLSTTSEDVCEVWDKRGVVRKVNGGDASVKQIMYQSTPGSQFVWNMWEAESAGRNMDREHEPYITRRDKHNNPLTMPENPELRKNWSSLPPNLTLNAHTPIENRHYIWFCAGLGFMIQAGVTVLQGVGYYHLRWMKDFTVVDNYGFPLACAGTWMIVFGVWICSAIIRASTHQVLWIPAERTKVEKKKFQVMWVQQGQVEQSFSSYAIYRDDPKSQSGDFLPIWGSYLTRNPRTRPLLNFSVGFAALLCISGFLIQLVGLRALHWSATIAQLIATLLMILLRSNVRSGLSREPKTEELEKGYELDKVALNIAGLSSCKLGPRFLYWKDIDENNICVPRDENPIIEIRAKLGAITKWENAHTATACTLYTVILETLNLAATSGGLKDKLWLDVDIEIDARQASLEFKQSILLKFDKGPHTQWTADPAMLFHLEGLISLWMYTYLYVEEPKVEYYEKGLSVPKWLEVELHNRVLNDFLVIIGNENDKDKLNILSSEIQSIVKIVNKDSAASLKTSTLLRNYIPVLDCYDSETKSEEKPTEKGEIKEPKKKRKEKPDFIPRENLFGCGQSSITDNRTFYAYKYPSSLGLEVEGFEPKKPREQREAFKTVVEQIFAHQIYASVVRALVDSQKDKGIQVLKFTKEDITWLGQTFTREELGSLEQAYVCLFPAYDILKDKEQRRQRKQRRKEMEEKALKDRINKLREAPGQKAGGSGNTGSHSGIELDVVFMKPKDSLQNSCRK